MYPRISMQDRVKHLPETPKTRKGHIQLIRMDKSTCQKRVDLMLSFYMLIIYVSYLCLPYLLISARNSPVIIVFWLP